MTSRATPEQRAVITTALTSDSPTCVLWPGPFNAYGYGVMPPTLVTGRSRLAHREIYLRATGADPSGVLVCHRCDTPACILPADLFLGTHADNSADMVAKGRQSHRRTRPCVLTDEQVLAIREAHTSGEWLVDLAPRYGVSASFLSRLTRGQRRATVP